MSAPGPEGALDDPKPGRGEVHVGHRAVTARRCGGKIADNGPDA